MKAQVVDAHVNERQAEAAQRPEAYGALQRGFVFGDFVFEFDQAAGLSVAEKGFHLSFEHGEIGEYEFFEFGHKRFR
jgi:hypothetical protein